MGRQLTDRELAWVGIGLGAMFTFAGVVALAAGSWDGLLIIALGVTCLVLGWGRRKDRHNPDEMPRFDGRRSDNDDEPLGPAPPWRGAIQMVTAVALSVAAFFVPMDLPNWAIWLISAFLFVQGARDLRKARPARKP